MRNILINISYYFVLAFKYLYIGLSIFFKYFYIYTHNFFTWIYNQLSKYFGWNKRFYYAHEDTPNNTPLNKIKAFFKLNNKDRKKDTMATDYKQKFEECFNKGYTLFINYQNELKNTKKLNQEIIKLTNKIGKLRVENINLKKEVNQLKSYTSDKIDTRTPAEILGLKLPITPIEIKKAYNHLVNRYHPDKHIHMSNVFKAELNSEFIKIQDAYKNLKNIL